MGGINYGWPLNEVIIMEGNNNYGLSHNDAITIMNCPPMM